MNTQNVKTAASESSERWVEDKKNQFTVIVTGEAEYYEENMRDTFIWKSHFAACSATTITEAANKIADIHTENCWEILQGESAPINFEPQHVEIRDNQNRKVLCAIVINYIEWVEPLTYEVAVNKAEKKQASLKEQVHEERRWDNFSTAKMLENQIAEIGLRIIDKAYRQHPEIVDLLEKQEAKAMYDQLGPEMDYHDLICQLEEAIEYEI